MKNRKRRKRKRKQRPQHAAINHGRPAQPKASMGEQIGGTLGRFAEGAIKSLFGSGDYSEEAKAGGFDVDQNTIIQEPMTAAQVPAIHGGHGKTEMIRVRHREFIRDFSASTFAVYATYRLNPTDPLTFPWLSAIAGRFEQWRPLGIVFEFVSSCGNAVSSTNAALGTVSMATQYDYYAPAFSTKTELLNHYYATSGKTSQNQMHAIECAPSEMQVDLLWTDSHAIAGDANLSDLGYTFVWREGSQAAYTAGELWVTYDIELYKPKMTTPAPPPSGTTGGSYRAMHPELFPDLPPLEPLERKDGDPVPDDLQLKAPLALQLTPGHDDYTVVPPAVTSQLPSGQRGRLARLF